MDTDKPTSNFDIAIVGGGMVGASLACALAESGLKIALFDGVKFDSTKIPYNSPQTIFDPRVSAIAPASRLWLEQINVWHDIEAARLTPYSQMHVWDADGTGAIHFAAKDINENQLGYIVENTVILNSLYKRLNQLENVSLLAPAKVENIDRRAGAQHQTVAISIEGGDQYSATLIIGADGPNSRVRHLAGFETKEWDYQHQAIVTTVRTELPHQSRALQRFMDTGPLAFLPLSEKGGDSKNDQHYCSIVWSAIPERAEELMNLTDDEFASALGDSIEHRLGEIERIDKRFSFPLRQRHAVDYVQENIALVGDAAHTIHPLAGQGVNLGFLDVKALQKEILFSLDNNISLAEFRTLRRYQRQRIGHNLGMMWLMEGFKKLFAEQALPVRWLRNVGLTGVDQAPIIKNKMMRQAMGI